MTVWILMLVHTVQLANVPIITSYNPFLFESQTACEAARPALQAKAAAFAPTGYSSPVESSVKNCLPIRVLSAQELLDDLKQRHDLLLPVSP